MYIVKNIVFLILSEGIFCVFNTNNEEWWWEKV